MTYAELYRTIGARPDDDDATVARKLDEWADAEISNGGRWRLTDYIRAAVAAEHRRQQRRAGDAPIASPPAAASAR